MDCLAFNKIITILIIHSFVSSFIKANGLSLACYYHENINDFNKSELSCVLTTLSIHINYNKISGRKHKL